MERIIDKKHHSPEGIVNQWIKSLLNPVYLYSFQVRQPIDFLIVFTSRLDLAFCYLQHKDT